MVDSSNWGASVSIYVFYRFVENDKVTIEYRYYHDTSMFVNKDMLDKFY